MILGQMSFIHMHSYNVCQRPPLHKFLPQKMKIKKNTRLQSFPAAIACGRQWATAE